MATAKDLKDFNDLWIKLQQASGVSNPVQFPFDLFSSGTQAPGVTVEPLTLFVDPVLGNDRAPGTLSAPFRTIQAAISVVPKKIRHLVKVQLAAGDYQGFQVSGFEFEPLENGTTCGLHIIGTLATATLATGTATGTLTAATASVAATATFTVLTDSAQSWTVDNLRGKFIEINTGTGAGSIIPILSNTATALTIAASAVTSAAGATYTIRDCASVVTTPILSPGSLAAFNGNQAAPTNVGIQVWNNGSSSRTGHLRFECLRVSFASPASTWIPFLISNPGCILNIVRSQFVNSTVSTHMQINNGCPQLGITQCVFDALGTASTYINTSFWPLGQAPGLSVSGCLMRPMNGVGLNCGSISINNTQMDTAIGINFGGPAVGLVSGIMRMTGSSQAFRARSASNFCGGVFIQQITGSGTLVDGRSVGVELDGINYAQFDGTLIVQNCTTGFSLNNGGRCKLSAASTIATTTNEVVLNGVTSTVATMRAASPKITANVYGSMIYE